MAGIPRTNRPCNILHFFKCAAKYCCVIKQKFYKHFVHDLAQLPKTNCSKIIFVSSSTRLYFTDQKERDEDVIYTSMFIFTAIA